MSSPRASGGLGGQQGGLRSGGNGGPANGRGIPECEAATCQRRSKIDPFPSGEFSGVSFQPSLTRLPRRVEDNTHGLSGISHREVSAEPEGLPCGTRFSVARYLGIYRARQPAELVVYGDRVRPLTGCDWCHWLIPRRAEHVVFDNGIACVECWDRAAIERGDAPFAGTRTEITRLVVALGDWPVEVEVITDGNAP